MNTAMNMDKKLGECGMAARLVTIALILAALFALPGCAAVALSAIGPAAEFGIDQATSGTTAKTYTASMDHLRLAALKSLSRMEMDVVEDDGDAEEWSIEAEAEDRTIDVDLKALTAKTTRVKVSADNGSIFFHDEATAEEVVAQITESLDRDMQFAGGAVLASQGGEQ